MIVMRLCNIVVLPCLDAASIPNLALAVGIEDEATAAMEIEIACSADDDISSGREFYHRSGTVDQPAFATGDSHGLSLGIELPADDYPGTVAALLEDYVDNIADVRTCIEPEPVSNPLRCNRQVSRQNAFRLQQNAR